jgi:FMN-dependent oxidoreductase (nitrilotriacetate monooxygenase family)
VTSYLDSAYRNGLGGEPRSHDERYDQADEFMEVVGKLWEKSWEDGAVIRDAEADVHTDPSRVHKIHHEGEHYRVEGPHMCEPSPQRTPFLLQAGTSPRGIAFAARHAEAMFVTLGGGSQPRRTKEAVVEATEAAGRDPESVKLLSGLSLVVGETEAEAQAKHEQLRAHGSPEGAFALFGGWSGVDLAPYAKTDRIQDFASSGIQSVGGLLSKLAGPGGTFGDLAENVRLGGMQRVIVGSPAQVVDRMEKMVEDAGLDGFNILPNVQPGGFDDLVDLVIPELQRRGRFRKAYEGTTLRERFAGGGRPHLPEDHPSRK